MERRALFSRSAAYLLWGILPFYLKSVAHMPAMEVVAHRIVWSVPIAGALLWWLGLFGDLKIALTTPRMLAMATLTASLITLNWGTYVWAIGSGHAIDTALGYYINPLVNVVLGGIFLSRTPVETTDGCGCAGGMRGHPADGVRPVVCRGFHWCSPSASVFTVSSARLCRSVLHRASCWRFYSCRSRRSASYSGR